MRKGASSICTKNLCTGSNSITGERQTRAHATLILTKNKLP